MISGDKYVVAEYYKEYRKSFPMRKCSCDRRKFTYAWKRTSYSHELQNDLPLKNYLSIPKFRNSSNSANRFPGHIDFNSDVTVELWFSRNFFLSFRILFAKLTELSFDLDQSWYEWNVMRLGDYSFTNNCMIKYRVNVILHIFFSPICYCFRFYP